MSAVKNVTTLAIIFALLIGVKHEVGCLRRATEEFQWPGIELRSQQSAGKTHQDCQRTSISGAKEITTAWGVECNGETLLYCAKFLLFRAIPYGRCRAPPSCHNLGGAPNS